MKKTISLLLMMVCAGFASAQTITYTDSIQWEVYDAFHKAFWCNSKKNYKSDTAQPSADHRGNGDRDKDYSGCSAAIWCQAIYYDMAINAYRRAVSEGDADRIRKYKLQATQVYNGLKAHYVNFNFDDCNTNNGWFVYDDIMWWTAALARASILYSTEEAKNTSMAKNCLNYSEKSFLRVWYGSAKVGDDGSYADPARDLGGGMFWEWQPISNPKPHKKGDFRSACINFPTVIAACLLHQLVPEGRSVPTATRPTQQTKEWYLEKAKEVYEWANSTLVQNGRVADGIHGGGPEFTDHLYNQGTYIGASCLLYKLTGETKYLTNAKRGANYVFNSMSASGSILPLEKGYEQGVYCAIFAQYMDILTNELGQSTYLTYIKRNIQAGWKRIDSMRNLSSGDFLRNTVEGATLESYPASGLPALMLLFPVGDSRTGMQGVTAELPDVNSDVYTLDGKRIKTDASLEDVGRLDSGMYIYKRHKMRVK